MDILVADDDATIVTLLEEVLARGGLNVLAHRNGDDAYRSLSAPDGPAIALIDWEMPGTDGPTLSRRVRELDHGRARYLIMLAARCDQESLVHGLEAGADDFVCKPFETTELLARIEVGRRGLEVQRRMLEKEKLQGVLEMAGAVCHELNQPLQSATGYAKMLLADSGPEERSHDMLTRLSSDLDRIGRLTRRIMGVTEYRARNYLGKQRIVDISEAAPDSP